MDFLIPRSPSARDRGHPAPGLFAELAELAGLGIMTEARHNRNESSGQTSKVAMEEIAFDPADPRAALKQLPQAAAELIQLRKSALQP